MEETSLVHYNVLQSPNVAPYNPPIISASITTQRSKLMGIRLNMSLSFYIL